MEDKEVGLKKKEIKFALMGCGRIAKRHAELLSSGEIPQAKLVGVCDPDPQRAQAFEVQYKAPSFSSAKAMIGATEPDVVSVLTPSGMHAEHVCNIAPLVPHVLVEKPMALTLSDADRMIETCDRHSTGLYVVKQNRLNKPVQKLRQAVEGGRLGRLFLGTVRVRWMRDQGYYDQDPWRGTWALDGGAFTNQASHHIDLLSWMMGDVQSVFAKSGTFGVNTETEDTGVAILTFASGALGVIEATTATRPENLEGSLSLLGTRGSVEIAGFAVNQLRHWRFSEPDPDGDREVLQAHSENPPDVYGFGHRRYLEQLVQKLLSDSSQLVGGLEGRKSLEIINALYESIETGKEVSVRFQPRHCRLGRHAVPES